MDNNQLKGMFQNPAMLGLLQNKLDSLVGAPSDYIASLPAVVKKRLNALKNLQDDQMDLEAQFQKEVMELEKKYLALYQPMFDKRSEIVNGKYEPTEEETTRDPEEDEDEAAEDVKPKSSSAKITEIPEFPADIKGVPEFWLTIFKNHPHVSEMVTDKDEQVLKHLVDIKLSYLDNNPGFKLDFYFDGSDACKQWFSNDVLSKTYYLTSSADSNISEVVYDRAEGTNIDWKEGKDLSVTVEIKKQRHKGTNKTRTVKRTVPAETFFTFFSPPQPPKEEDEEDVDEEALDELEEKLEADYAVGELIKEKFIPRAVDWFTGKALDYEDNYDEDDEDEGDYDEFEGGEGDEDEEDDEDDDDDDAAPVPAAGVAAAQQPAPECKQQ